MERIVEEAVERAEQEAIHRVEAPPTVLVVGCGSAGAARIPDVRAGSGRGPASERLRTVTVSVDADALAAADHELVVERQGSTPPLAARRLTETERERARTGLEEVLAGTGAGACLVTADAADATGRELATVALTTAREAGATAVAVPTCPRNVRDLDAFAAGDATFPVDAGRATERVDADPEAAAGAVATDALGALATSLLTTWVFGPGQVQELLADSGVGTLYVGEGAGVAGDEREHLVADALDHPVWDADPPALPGWLAFVETPPPVRDAGLDAVGTTVAERVGDGAGLSPAPQVLRARVEPRDGTRLLLFLPAAGVRESSTDDW